MWSLGVPLIISFTQYAFCPNSVILFFTFSMGIILILVWFSHLYWKQTWTADILMAPSITPGRIPRPWNQMTIRIHRYNLQVMFHTMIKISQMIKLQNTISNMKFDKYDYETISSNSQNKPISALRPILKKNKIINTPLN